MALALVASAAGRGAERPDYVLADAPVLALTHVQVIDGTGAAAREDQTILVAEGKIAELGPAAEISVPPDAQVLDLAGRTVLPGLVMLHEHMMYFSGRAIWHSQPVSYPRLYLAGGVTTLRTAGTEPPEVDLNLKRRIDAGESPGPKIHLTGPYFNGPGGGFLGDSVVRNAEEARRAVAYWAERGFTSFKVYDAIQLDVLRAVIEEAHVRGLTVTGHLASVSCREAARLGIDFIEHSFGSCPKDLGIDPEESESTIDPSSPAAQALIDELVRSGVVLVSTPFATDRPLTGEELEALHPQARENYLRGALEPPPWWPDSATERAVRELERAFVAAGGRLGVGTDAADFGLIAGYANHRALRLLVEAGWSPLEVLRLATSTGAELLGVGDAVGRVATGWAADLIVVAGDPSRDISELSKIEMVLKDGVAYDPRRLQESVRGLAGWH